MNSNMFPVRPGMGSPYFVPPYNIKPPCFPMQQHPTSGTVVYPTVSGTSMSYQATGGSMAYQCPGGAVPFQTVQGSKLHYQQQNQQFQNPCSSSHGSYILPAVGSQQTSPLSQMNYSSINRPLGNQIMVVGSQTPPSPLPEFYPNSPLSPRLQTGIQPRLTSPLSRSATSPGTSMHLSTVSKGFIAAYNDDQNFYSIGEIDDLAKAPTVEEIFKAKAANYGISITTKSEKIMEATARAFRHVEDQKFKKLVDDKKIMEEIKTQNFMNKATKYGITIENPLKYPLYGANSELDKHTHSELEKHTHSELEKHTHSEPEKHTHSELEKHTHSELEKHTHSEPEKHTHSEPETHIGSDPEKHTHSELEKHTHSEPEKHTHSEPETHIGSDPEKHTHSEPNSSDVGVEDVKNINRNFTGGFPQSNKENVITLDTNKNSQVVVETAVVDDEKIGIECNHILYALESKRKSNYEQLLTTLRRKSYAHEDIEDLSTSELQSPRDGSTPVDWGNFSDSPSRQTDSPYMSDDLIDENVKIMEYNEENDSVIIEAAHKIVKKAMTSALQELRVEGILQRAKEKRKVKATENVYTWISQNKESKGDNTSAQSDTDTDKSASRSHTPYSVISEKSSGNSTPFESADSSMAQTIESSVSELNPQSPEFKPSGFKKAQNINQMTSSLILNADMPDFQQTTSSSVLKANVPDFVPSAMPTYLSHKTTSFANDYLDNMCKSYIDNYQAGLFCNFNYQGTTRETQTDIAELTDAMTNTRQVRTCNQSVETKSCDVREIVINTVESMFDQASDFFISDNTEEVDHGHLDVYVQTDENDNYLKLKLIDAQRELLRTRCYACKQQLDQEKEHMSSSKYQMSTIFPQQADRTAVNEIVDRRISFINSEIQGLQNKLMQYEQFLDKGCLFDKVPDFGVSFNLDSVINSSFVATESTEMQTETSGGNLQEKSCGNHSPRNDDTAKHRRFLTEALKKVLNKLDSQSCVYSQCVEVLHELKNFCQLTVDQMKEMKFCIESSETERRGMKCIEINQNSAIGNINMNSVDSMKTVHDNVISEKSKGNNFQVADCDIEEIKENVPGKKGKKSKKGKKKKEQITTKSPEKIPSESEETHRFSGNSTAYKSPKKESISSSKSNADDSSKISEKLNVLTSIAITETMSVIKNDEEGELNTTITNSADEETVVDSKKIQETICSLEEIDDDVEVDLTGRSQSDTSQNSQYLSALSCQTSLTTICDNYGESEKETAVSDVSENVLSTPTSECLTQEASVVSEFSQIDTTSSTVTVNAYSSNSSSSETSMQPDQFEFNNSYSALYEAVVQQINQVYPHMASNPVMLNMIAAQQTAILQAYIAKSGGSGSTNPMQAIGMASGGMTDSTAIPVSGISIQQFGVTDTVMTNQMPTAGVVNSLSSHSNSNIEMQNLSSVKLEQQTERTTYSSKGDGNATDANFYGTSCIKGQNENVKRSPVKDSMKLTTKISLSNQSNNDPISTKNSLQNSGIPRNINNCNSFLQKMDAADEDARFKVRKSLSSSIMDDSTIRTQLRPPGFGKQHDFSVESVNDEMASCSGSSTIVPSKSSSFDKLMEGKGIDELKFSPVTTTQSLPKRIIEETKVTQKPLEVPSSGFTFSKSLIHNLPQPNGVEQPQGISNANKNPGVKTPLLSKPDKRPPLLPPPVSQRSRNLSQPSTTIRVMEPVRGNLSGLVCKTQASTDLDKKWQFPPNNTYSNLPPRLQGKRRSFENTPASYQPPEQSWDDEVDDYAEPFILHYDVRKPIETHVRKAVVDELEDIPVPEKRKTDENENIDEKKEEDWCQVTKKKKKETKSEVPKQHRTRHGSTTSTDKACKSNNFERLVNLMTEIFTGLSRTQIVEVISEVRAVRGGLSGLTVKEIVEIARTVVIRKFEHKMTNNQRPLQDFVKGEQQEIVSGYPTGPITTSNRFDAMETAEERANRMKAYNAMKARQSLQSSEDKPYYEEDDICVICHDELTFGDTKTLDCKHEFHTECISKWVYERERTCPTCRGHALFVEDFPKLGS